MPDSQRLPREEMAENIALRKAMMENTAAYRESGLDKSQQRIDTGNINAATRKEDVGSKIQKRVSDMSLGELKAHQNEVNAEINARGKDMTTGKGDVTNLAPTDMTPTRQAQLTTEQTKPGLNTARTAEATAQTSAIPEKLALENRRINMEGGLRSQIIGLRKQGLDNQMGARMEKIYEPAQDADTRYKVMLKAMENPTPQGDVQLLFNHMGMTLGAQKGARMTDAEIKRALTARSVPQELLAAYTKATNGQMLTPEQRENYVRLGGDMREQQWAKADQLAGTLTGQKRPESIAGKTNAAPDLNTSNKGQGNTIGGSTGPKVGDVQSHLGASYKFDGKQWKKQ
jgi:hypothetical protein